MNKSALLVCSLVLALIAGLGAGMAGGFAAPSAAGDLDPSFGTGGKATVAFRGGNDVANAVAIQPDGKVVVAGDTGGNFGLARYLADGTPDAGFGTHGKVRTNLAPFDDGAMAVAVQADGKIIAAGVKGDPQTNQFALIRYTSSGHLDSSFGTAGQVTFGTGEARALALQSDGKIVVAGSLTVARLLTNGSLDTSFGQQGTVSLQGIGSANAVAIQPDGKIVVAGTSGDFFLLRLRTTGSRDSSFGTNGLVVTDFGGDDTAYSVALQPDGKLVTLGYTTDPNQGTLAFALARYLPNGTLDSGFGTAGKTQTALGWFPAGFDDPTGLGIQADGKIVAAGRSYDPHHGGPPAEFTLARYTAAGSLDRTFGANGLVYTAFEGDAFAHALTITPAGQPLAAGYAGTSATGDDFALVRYTAGGQLDTGFGANGKRTTDFGTGTDSAQALAIQPDGRIVVAGSNDGGGGSIDQTIQAGDFAVARLLADGQPDSSFGNAGLVTTDFDRHRDSAAAISIQPDGKIVVAGGYHIHYFDRDFTERYSGFALARYTNAGALDPAFGSAGIVTTTFGTDGAQATALALQPDGKILAAGQIDVFCGPSCSVVTALARYNANGSLDSSFGAGGEIVDNGEGAYNAVAVQTDGKILAAGTLWDYPASDVAFLLKRFLPDGTTDPTFGISGTVTTDLPGHDAVITALLVKPDGKILAGGYSGDYSNYDFTLARYNPDGSLDPGFGQGGVTTTTFAGTSAYLRAIARQTDGKIVAAGAAGAAFALARYSPDGILDPSFGTGGRVTTTVGTYTAGYALALQHDAKLVVAGQGWTGTTGIDFALARYLNPPPPPTPTIGAGCLFSDVCPADYFFTPVQYLVAHGVLSGYGDNTFRPYAAATRGQLAKILVLAQGWPLDTGGGPHFTDVPTTHPFYAYVETAYHHGVISGYADNTFHPYANITRGQLSKVLVLAFGWPTDTSGGPHFTDVPPSQPFYAFVETAYHRGILSGYGDHTFRPYADSVRGQIAKLVYNALQAAPTPTGTATPSPVPSATEVATTATATAVATATSTPGVTGTATASATTTTGPSMKSGGVAAP